MFIFTTEQSCQQHHQGVHDARIDNPVNQPALCIDANEESERRCARNGICSHEVLRDGKHDSDSKMVRKVYHLPQGDVNNEPSAVSLLIDSFQNLCFWGVSLRSCVCLCAILLSFLDAP